MWEGRAAQWLTWPSNVIPSPGVLHIASSMTVQPTSAAATARVKLSSLQLIPPEPHSEPAQNPGPRPSADAPEEPAVPTPPWPQRRTAEEASRRCSRRTTEAGNAILGQGKNTRMPMFTVLSNISARPVSIIHRETVGSPHCVSRKVGLLPPCPVDAPRLKVPLYPLA